MMENIRLQTCVEECLRFKHSVEAHTTVTCKTQCFLKPTGTVKVIVRVASDRALDSALRARHYFYAKHTFQIRTDEMFSNMHIDLKRLYNLLEGLYPLLFDG
jgi:hypothetical protein